MTRDDVALEVLQAMIVRTGVGRDAGEMEKMAQVAFHVADEFMRMRQQQRSRPSGPPSAPPADTDPGAIVRG